MHCMFLGWLQYVCGSIMYLLVYEIMDGEPLQNLLAIEVFIKTYQKTHETKYKFRPRLAKLTMFQPKKGYPKLKAKAGDVLGLGPAMLALWSAHMSHAEITHRRIRLLLDLNVRIAKTLDDFAPARGYMAVPDPPYSELTAACLNMVQLHGQLLEHFKEADVKVFNLTAKSHFVVHVLLLSRYVHPYLVWCFKGEQMMRRWQGVWQSCLSGAKPELASTRAALKYRSALGLRFTHPR